ncbi:hypothetical protein J6590_040318 [Homalodisca vitripennis]|nr:hypothetical protein J6590_040318 [Homalodisca vitripennis]
MRTPALAAAAVLLLGSVILVSPAKLPSYIKPCKRSDPNLNACVFKHGMEALPFIIRGDPKYGIPKLDPLVIEKVVVGDSKVSSSGLGLTFTCNKCRLLGLRDIQPLGVRSVTHTLLVIRSAGLNPHNGGRIDLEKRHLELEGKLPKLQVSGKYTARGKVLILPIEGAGNSDLTITDLHLVYKAEFDLRKGKDGRDHARIKDPSLDFKAGGFNIKLTNLFKGDENLGNQMNLFLNNNWRDVMAEFGPAISEAVTRIATLIVNNVSEKVPFDEYLLNQ